MPTERENLDALVRATKNLVAENADVARQRKMIEERERLVQAQASRTRIGETAPED